MVVTGGGVLWDGIRLSISEIIDPPWKHGDSISNLFIAAMRPAELILVDQEWPNRIICRQSADPICAGAAMSNSIVRRTVWITAGVWAVLILAVIIQSMLGVTVAGARPEASRLIITMTLPITAGMSVVAIGAAIAIGWWRSRQRAASGNE